LVAAPPSDGRRSCSGERKQRRCTADYGGNELRCMLGPIRELGRCVSSPSLRRDAQERLRWSDGVVTVGEDGGRERRRWLGEVDLGRVGSIPGAGLASRGRRSTWRSRRGSGRSSSVAMVGGRVELGFRKLGKEEERDRRRLWRGIYRVSGGRRRALGQQRRPGRVPLHRAGALPRVADGKDEDDDLVFGLILAKRYAGLPWAVLGSSCWVDSGLLLGFPGWAAAAGKSISSPSSIFFFCFTFLF
jgi:hypothetical protein